jgi:hypothetical protein
LQGVEATAIPTKGNERWHRNLPLGFVVLVILAPCALFFATLPGNASDGVIDIGGGGLRTVLWAAVVVLVVAALLAASFRWLWADHEWLWADHELLFGCLTICAVLTTVAVFASVFVRRHVENNSAAIFLGVAALSVAALILIAHDWARRQLVIAAVVAAAALSVFIVRVGFESLDVPPKWERAQIAARAQADENALEAQHTRALPGLMGAARDDRAALSVILARTPAPYVDPKLLAQANVILSKANKSLATIDQAAFRAFDVLAANEPVTFPPAATTELADAVHKLKTSAAGAATQIDHSALDQAICAVTGHEISQKTKTCDITGRDQITSNRAWVVAKHELDVELAAYRAAITGTDPDKAGLKAVLAQQPDVNEDISILAAVEKGPETLWRSAFQSTGSALVPGPLGWVVLGALLLGLLGWLLKVNARQLPGPVDVLPGDTKSDNDNRLVKVLRVAVLQNVPEPGAAPGADSANPVTDLLDIASGPLAAVSKLVQSVLRIVGRRYGYQISMDVTTDAPAASGAGTATGSGGTSAATTRVGDATVLIRVMSISGEVTLASRIFPSPADKVAVRCAGLWAAGYILNRSSRIPSWAAWDAETAHAVTMATSNSDLTIPALESAVKEAPNSGILLCLLGHHYELAGRRIEAINSYARAVTAHPRYSVARYRLGTTLASMRHDRDWGAKDPTARQDDLRAVETAITALKVNDDGKLCKLRAAKGPVDASPEFKSLATTLLRALAKDTQYPYRLVNALRRSSRDSIWPSLAPMSTGVAAAFHPLVKSSYKALGDKGDLEKLEEKAGKPGSWWQISYNAACGYASNLPDAEEEHKAAQEAAQNAKQAEKDATVGALKAALEAAQNPTEAAKKAAQEAAQKQQEAEQKAKETAEEAERKAEKVMQDAETALDLLEQALVRRGVHQLSADWVKEDSDLKCLKTSHAAARFDRFLARLRLGDLCPTHSSPNL